MYKLSNLAADDFGAVYEYTWRKFGPGQADKYTDELDLFLRLLSANPQMGRDCSNIIEGVRRHDHRHHSVFYQPSDDSIFVIRILHQQMNPLLHLK
ncbi:type II toxin-antitoxin system RelE/ParE family toxin [Lelliottia wanjuensis]|uniref:type II toxin-antitoxin system RelE/ParE family toxin n=1 Tax=Lelliottia wanjuensis TaxID=3050585 RepID=UPI00254F6D0D|nr:type II toxin-antitoxin system RelE/ParE family toxin [Lelliottia sp. V86_10]MDK9584733.1 type II toxin-antitoxin system RelE/ParE family toxin [Lelliottia sp. V86_10]